MGQESRPAPGRRRQGKRGSPLRISAGSGNSPPTGGGSPAGRRSRSCLVRYAEQLGISEAVKFHGFSSEIHKIMAESAIYVSSSDYEGISNSMLEALAIGIPAVCTDCPVGGARMYIRDGENGYLIPVGDADVMADRMLALMEDKKLGESFSKESVKIREELTDDRIFGMWKALLVR